MSDTICPISKSEFKQLDFIIKELKNHYREQIEEKMMANGFSMASILNFDDTFIMVEIKYGVAIAIPELCFTKNVKIIRSTMQIVEEPVEE